MSSSNPDSAAPLLAAPEAQLGVGVGVSGAATSVDQQRLAAFFQDVHSIATSLLRIADHVDPQPGDIVGTPYVAEKLGCTTAWITELIKTGEIPSRCLVEGTGNGKPWKLHRRATDEWIKGR